MSGLDIDDHFLVYVCVAHHITEFLEGYLAVFVLVCKQDRLVDYLLKLRVFKVVADHHFEDLKQLPIGYKPVVVHVIDAEREPQLRELVSLHAELGDSLDELLEVHLRRERDGGISGC